MLHGLYLNKAIFKYSADYKTYKKEELSHHSVYFDAKLFHSFI